MVGCLIQIAQMHGFKDVEATINRYLPKQPAIGGLFNSLLGHDESGVTPNPINNNVKGYF